ncbi:MAG: glutamine-hydrolyzing GMP synthase subunit GuaA, partial [Candidatus Thermoplasmatota archaeon]|nr:glutamine-hydrolyzing GMP synthase subunit GuaA [Candidatus Thermoplasmatota archaeon]
DGMSGTFSRPDWEFLDRLSTRITNENTSINRVVYDITNKPPGTIEWE